MEITDVRVVPVEDEKLKAFASVVFDGCFVVSDIRVILGPAGLFVSMPSRRRRDGTFRDIAHPLNSAMRRRLEEAIVGRYRETVAGNAVALRPLAGGAEGEEAAS